MPRRARIHFVSLRSSLVNLPISIYGPLLEKNIRPQNLAIHLTAVPSPQAGGPQIEACVGWTGMASASSLAHFDASNPGDKGLETIEIDPQYAQGLGLNQGDIVEIGLLHDLPFAKSVTTEPLSSDDWEIIEIHAAHVESTLLSQVRVARIGQELDAWIMGRTRVRLQVTHLDPDTIGKTCLLTTDTEVSIAPKPHRNQQSSAPTSNLFSGKAAQTKGPENENDKLGTPQVLRVIPPRTLGISLPEHQGIELVGYVPRRIFVEIQASSKVHTTETSACIKTVLKRLVSPIDPTQQSSGHKATPEQQTSKSGTTEQNAEGEDGSKVYVYIGTLEDIPAGHIVFPAAPEGVDDWDLVAVIPFKDTDSTIWATLPAQGDVPAISSGSSLAGIGDILERCVNFCIRHFFIHSASSVTRGVTSLLVTGRKGAGKTSIVQAIAKVVQNDATILAYTHFVDVSRYTDKPQSLIKALFQFWFDKVSWHRPSILILDNLDSLLSAEVEHADSFRARHLTELFLSVYGCSARTAAPNTRGIVLLATAASTASLHSLVNSSHIFKDVVHVHPPNKNARRDILASIVKDHLAAAHDIQEDGQSPVNFTTVATQTEGYSATDLKDLVARAMHQVAIRASKINSSALLSAADFTAAQTDFIPLSLRNVKLEKSEVAWTDVGGLHDTRRVLRETLEWPTKYAQIFAQSPLRLRSGLLLYGYPGCGKTLLASAVAKECGLNFISVKGPEILNKYIGASEKSVRDLFERASAAKPCILFFDEFDSIAPKRGHDSTGVTDRVVNQMLTQMDGAEGLDGVYVLAATSRPDLIDSALLRPGRLDKSLFCNMPDTEERADILLAVSRKVSLSPTVDLNEVARQTEGYSGADLQALLYNAHLEVIHASITNLPDSSLSTNNNEDPVTFSIFGGSAENKITSRAEQMVLEQRLRRIQAASRSEETVTKSRTVLSEKIYITMDHIQRVLKSMRPSVSPPERARLDRIYRSFLSDRDGPLPTPPEAGSIGNRVSLA